MGSKKRAGGAITSTKHQPNEILAEIVGSSTARTRGDFMKKVWEYVHDYAEKVDGGYLADDLLQDFIGKKKFKATDIPGAISRNLE